MAARKLSDTAGTALVGGIVVVVFDDAVEVFDEEPPHAASVHAASAATATTADSWDRVTTRDRSSATGPFVVA
jgi:hypothetical protein